MSQSLLHGEMIQSPQGQALLQEQPAHCLAVVVVVVVVVVAAVVVVDAVAVVAFVDVAGTAIPLPCGSGIVAGKLLPQGWCTDAVVAVAAVAVVVVVVVVVVAVVVATVAAVAAVAVVAVAVAVVAVSLFKTRSDHKITTTPGLRYLNA